MAAVGRVSSTRGRLRLEILIDLRTDGRTHGRTDSPARPLLSSRGRSPRPAARPPTAPEAEAEAARASPESESRAPPSAAARAMAAPALPPLPPLPPQLKSIQHHLRTAQELDKREPVVAYYCE